MVKTIFAALTLSAFGASADTFAKYVNGRLVSLPTGTVGGEFAGNAEVVMLIFPASFVTQSLIFSAIVLLPAKLS